MHAMWAHNQMARFHERNGMWSEPGTTSVRAASLWRTRCFHRPGAPLCFPTSGRSFIRSLFQVYLRGRHCPPAHWSPLLGGRPILGAGPSLDVVSRHRHNCHFRPESFRHRQQKCYYGRDRMFTNKAWSVPTCLKAATQLNKRNNREGETLSNQRIPLHENLPHQLHRDLKKHI